jgi:glycyl-tRNA synthetase beta chain
MPELLLEVGCEELPASFVPKAQADLQREVENRLREANLSFGTISTFGTPRRLILSVQDLGNRQPDETKEIRGPALKAAYDQDGNPTKALEGFCRSQGVDPATARKEGDYVYISKEIVGKPTAELLQTLLPEAIRALTFDKTMRWGSYRMRFARPLRWILAAFNGQAVPFTVESVASGIQSRGHRFEHPAPFEATSLDSLVKQLREKMVEPDASLRRERILAGSKAVASGTPDLPESLVQENAYLTEWPMPLEGTFDAQYSTLPEPVLVTVMAKHEKFFPVRDAQEKITNRFISIRNGGEESTVRAGNQWVLGCRFNDAMFFFNEDKKRTLADFLEMTRAMTFQEKLGTVRDRATRMAQIAEVLAPIYGLDIRYTKEAALYAKADLTSGMVGELASLQGAIGAEYARRDGMPDAIADAIGGHYDLSGSLASGNLMAVAVALADQLDKMAGYLGIGHVPSGSSDPYGMRRAAGHLIEAGIAHNLNLRTLLERAIEGFEGIELDHDAVFRVTADLLTQRYESAFPDARFDHLAAVLGASDDVLFRPAEVRARLEMIQGVEDAVVQSLTRAPNIVNAARVKGIEFGARNDAALDSAEGAGLAAAVSGELFDLVGPINAFFSATMVMVDDVPTRNARLALLADVASKTLALADFGKIEIA